MKYFLRYGGLWIAALLVYSVAMWVLPLHIGGGFFDVGVLHAAVGLAIWCSYGLALIE